MSLTHVEIEEVTQQEPTKATLRATVQTNVPNTKHLTQETSFKKIAKEAVYEQDFK